MADANPCPDTKAAIRTLIAGLEGPGPLNLHELGRSLNALPVYWDVSGSLFVTPDGEVLAVEHGVTVAQIESDPGWRLAARVAAAEKYPQLGSLLPERPVGTPDCAGCRGTGHFRLTGVTGDIVCGDCWGLGWSS